MRACMGNLATVLVNKLTNICAFTHILLDICSFEFSSFWTDPPPALTRALPIQKILTESLAKHFVGFASRFDVLHEEFDIFTLLEFDSCRRGRRAIPSPSIYHSLKFDPYFVPHPRSLYHYYSARVPHILFYKFPCSEMLYK